MPVEQHSVPQKELPSECEPVQRAIDETTNKRVAPDQLLEFDPVPGQGCTNGFRVVFQGQFVVSDRLSPARFVLLLHFFAPVNL